MRVCVYGCGSISVCEQVKAAFLTSRKMKTNVATAIEREVFQAEKLQFKREARVAPSH